MTQQLTHLPTILSQAQQGNAEAIATLINQALASEEIAATVNLDGSFLQVTLTSEKILPQDVWVYFVYDGLRRLGANSIQSVRVIGQQSDKPTPAWVQTFQMESFDSKIIPPVAATKREDKQINGEKKRKISLIWLAGAIGCIAIAALAIGIKNQPKQQQVPQQEKPTPVATEIEKRSPKVSPTPKLQTTKKPAKIAPRPRGTKMVLKKIIAGRITPKSVVHSGFGLFFAQNMMYSHTITVYNRDYKLVKTIPDRVNLVKYGYANFKGNYQGAPVEASFSHNGKYAWVSNYQMYGIGFRNPGSDRCSPSQNTDNSFLYRINTKTLQIEKAIAVGSVPKYVAASPDSRYVLVSNWCTWDLSVVDTQKNREIKRIKIGVYPRGIAIDRASKKAYVAVMGSSNIAQVNLQNFAVNWLNNIGRSPRHLNLDPSGRYLYASLNGEGKIAKIDVQKGKVIAKVYTGSTPRSTILSDDGEILYVVNYGENTVSKVRTKDMKVLQKVNVAASPIGITYDPQNREVWVACYSGKIMVFQD